MEQFGCCPKTAGNRERRVLFGWLNNGWNQGGSTAQHSLPNNTLSLPRDLSVTASGQLRQRFVPELQKLRQAHTGLSARPLQSGGMSNLQFVAGAGGLQLEIIARFKLSKLTLGKFGLVVLASADKARQSPHPMLPVSWYLHQRASGVRSAQKIGVNLVCTSKACTVHI